MKRDGKILPGNRKKELWKGIRRNYCLYLFLLPAVVFIGVFCYAPMYGVLMAFQDYSPGKGILGSPWVGLKWFRTFFELPRFWQIVKNTLVISLYSLVVGFPIPILLALMINSVKSTRFKKLTQTGTYMPHFISTVILVGMMSVFLSPRSGFLNHLIAMLGGPDDLHYMGNAAVFPHLYVWSGIWQNMGWSSIIYLAALAGVDQELYQAGAVDGLGRFGKVWHITLPGIAPTIILLFIMNIGNILNAGFEQQLLIGNPLTKEVYENIDTYVYRYGVQIGRYSFATAVGLMKSVIGFALVMIANKISAKVTDMRLF